MIEKAFNLLEEPWIRVMMADCTIQEVSLTQALTQAHTFSALAGELPTQDVAILRLLLAVLHTVFSRVDETGAEHPLQDADDALDRWEALWQAQQFPAEVIHAYLDAWHDRFYLFHPERPFYQVNEAAVGTEYTAAKLNGAISESSNKVRLFSSRVGAEKNSLSFSEAARWLLHLNGYDDKAFKYHTTDTPRHFGCLGDLALITAQGNNFFETLMLNLILLTDKGECWKENIPVWELDHPRVQDCCEIPLPDNPAQLLTLQSRRTLLVRDKNFVIKYNLYGGDFFNKANAFVEQMTVWAQVKGKGSQPSYIQPKHPDASKKMWREFSSMFVNEKDTHLPGVVYWQQRLQQNGLLPKKYMARFQLVSMQYDNSSSSTKDIFSDELGFHLELLTEIGKVWRDQILVEISTIDKLAQEVNFLGTNIERAAGGAGNVLGTHLKEQLYDRIDIPFRKFLASIDPADDSTHRTERLNHWRQEAKKIVLTLGKEAVSQAGPDAFVGRTITIKKKNKDITYHYSLPEAYNRFLGNIHQLMES